MHTTTIQLLFYQIMCTSGQITTLIDPAAHFISIFLVVVVYYNACQLFRRSPLTYILASLRSPDIFSCSNSSFLSSFSPSFNYFSLSDYHLYFIYCFLFFNYPFLWNKYSVRKSLQNYLSWSDDIRRVLHANQFNLDHYLHENIYTRVEPIADPDSPPPDIDETHCHAMDESFRKYEYSYARGIMMLYSPSTVSPKCATYAIVVHTFDGMKFLKEDYCLVKHDRHDRCRYVEMLRDKEGVELAVEPLRMSYTFRFDGKLILPAQAINLSKILIISTTIVRREATLTDTMQSQLS